MIYVYIALVGIAAGLVKGLSGFGSSLVTIPLLLMVLGNERYDEIVTILISFNVILNILLVKENKAYKLSNLKNFYPIVVTGALFTVVGIFFLKNIDGSIVEYIAAPLIFLAILVIMYNLYVPNKIHLKPNLPYKLIVGMLSGLGNGVASIDGPPVVFYLTSTGANKKKFKGTLASHFLIMGVIGVISLVALNMYSVDILINLLIMTVFTILGLLVGMRISKALNEKTFQVVVLVILIALDIKMVFF